MRKVWLLLACFVLTCLRGITSVCAGLKRQRGAGALSRPSPKDLSDISTGRGVACGILLSARKAVIRSMAAALLLGAVGLRMNAQSATLAATTITTYAGDGILGYTGDSGPATRAELNHPDGVAVDRAGNLYIADLGNNRIRKVDINGVIVTVAGNGIFGYSGDGGPATSAEFANPVGVAVDVAGNLYIADSDNKRIRKVDTNGIITTVVGNGDVGYRGDGGPATSAELSWPEGVAVDGAGNLYIVDTYNDCIRKVDTNNIITTVAGSGISGYSGDGGPATSAELANPVGVAVDSADNLYIADSGNNRVRKVDTNGIITTVAGNGNGGYSGDAGLAMSAELASPEGMVMDRAGNLYIADLGNNRIRKVDINGIITTVVGNGTFGYGGDGGPATSAKLNGPTAVAFDGSGRLYITDFSNGVIRRTGNIVPNVVGDTSATATAAITSLGLVVGAVTTSISSTVSVGNVISQSPQAGAQVGPGSSVNLVISSTPGQYSLTVTANPANGGNVTPSWGDYNAGFIVPITATPNAGYVFSGWSGPVANPSSASSTVTMNAAGSVTANFVPLVPKVVAETQAAATAAITSLGLVVGTVTTSPSSTVAAGAVISESPTAGTQVSPGSSVNLVISGVSSRSGQLWFVPVTPCRVVDTRNANGPLGGPAISGNSTRDFPILLGSCNVPPIAQAYSINVTAVPHRTLGYLTVWPTGKAQPYVSTLNSWDGRIKANAMIVPAGDEGAISVYATDDTDVVLDMDGYFASPADILSTQGLEFYPLTPCRAFDSRNANGPLGGPSFTANEARDIPVQQSACNLPSNAQAYATNVTVVPKQGIVGYLTTWPTGVPQPYVSTLNATTGQTTANAAIIPAGTNGSVSVFVTNPADVIIDVNGYFAPPSTGLSLYNLNPCRVLDTRDANPTQPFKGSLSPTLDPTCGVPSSAQALVLNATVVPPAALGYLTLWGAGLPQPYVSTLNSWDGTVTSNMAITPAMQGNISAYASNATQLILDVSGYFAP